MEDTDDSLDLATCRCDDSHRKGVFGHQLMAFLLSLVR